MKATSAGSRSYLAICGGGQVHVRDGGKPGTPVFTRILATPFRTMPDLSLGLTFLPQGGLDRRSRHLALSSWPIDALCCEADCSRSLRCRAWVQTRLWLLPVSSRPGIRRCVDTRPSNGGSSSFRRLERSSTRNSSKYRTRVPQRRRCRSRLCLSFWAILAPR